MKLHILGVCGTFMAGIAQIAQALGHDIVGIDQNVYPPMSAVLEDHHIQLISGYDNYPSLPRPDIAIIGNALSRGNPAVEYILNQKIPYVSGPEWLAKEVLASMTVLAVAGTHGKTTTSSLLAWILQHAGLEPGFLIGGAPANFAYSARLGGGKYFVIEADEYDTAFFDKRSKFIHYRPDIFVLNNLEFDHADIFDSLEAIMRQFHHAVRTVPQNGSIIHNIDDANITAVLQRGCWSKRIAFGKHQLETMNTVTWAMHGEYNALNALAAIAAAKSIGIPEAKSIEALSSFAGIKRRQEKIAQIDTIQIFEDFAHHPTAIRQTLQGFKERLTSGRIIVLLELASNTMRAGHHHHLLAPSLTEADCAYVYTPGKQDLALEEAFQNTPTLLYSDLDQLISEVVRNSRAHDNIIIMSNRDFGGIYKKLPAAIQANHS
jgi:UDP-N-acetylmuramate: L-alanyl-gamma-D-glutamyl-meso-diaminopimelate ligase